MRKSASRKRTQPAVEPVADLISPAQSSAGTPLEIPFRDNIDSGFIADHSELAYDSISQADVTFAANPNFSQQDRILYHPPLEASILPKEPLRQALIDSYLDNLFQYYAVVDHEDIFGPCPSTLLLQTVCLAGGLMRQSDGLNGYKISQTAYGKAKTLITLNSERDPLTLLKAICILSVWSPDPPTFISLDGPWHWTGIATRLAFQMGLHKEVTYHNKSDAKCRRRIWWHLFVSDKLQGACWGRPEAIGNGDFDVRELNLDDFEKRDTTAQLIVTTLQLHIILSDITKASAQHSTAEGISNIIAKLQTWLQNLPEDLRLFDHSGRRRPYCRPVREMFIIYFAGIILLQSKSKIKERSQRAYIPSVVASLCIVRLYEEIYCRQEIDRLLHIHGFFIMVASIPIIYCHPHKNGSQKEDLALLCAVLKQMRTKYGGAGMVLRKITWLQADAEKDSRRIQPPAQAEDMNALEFSQIDMRKLFDFPATIYPHMELLGHLSDSVQQPSWDLRDQNILPWSFEDTSFFTDMYAMDIDAFNLNYGGPGSFNEGSLVPYVVNGN
ncbi:hypothetical protein B0O99DRAFT_525517 [Bisporella sp. PMI_857]|nr:hypothetical protein B0O99DRAFT_525517 [Bisporella sp. PMI_857]